ncbi:glycoside hydrolase [Paraflavitalea soli]|uniref:Glycoside hydrolase n=1 Tax=Paraflavitalea soli TaxID=2315862 RepID=A0A3B7MZ51_9BACT|nr:glycoside hydrolase family 97 protein [Paraflavitalea soli]AXY78499.1 glycoside hydrolase [Paraflavitalea soli]
MLKKLLLLTLFSGLLLTTTAMAADIITVTSPDGQVRFHLFLEERQLYCQASFRGQPVLENTPVVVSLDGQVITKDITTGQIKTSIINERYPWLGVHAMAVNHCKVAVIPVRHAAVSYTLEVRVFNNGVAFRTLIPGNKDERRVPDEATVFNIPGGSTLWYHDMNMHYESVHVKKEIGDVEAGEWVAPPATIQLPWGGYAAITEADLRNYGGMSLQANGKNGLVIRLPQHQPTSYPYRLRYSAADTARLMQPAVITGAITTPWRVVMIGAGLDAMVNNDMVHNLCPPPDAKLFPQGFKTPWIKPGRAVWKYLDGGGDGTLEVMKKFTDGAAALGFEHNILEGFWTRWSDADIRELVNYSRNKGVSIWFWKHSKSLRDPLARDSFFRRCHDLGVAGAKIDFFDHEAKETIDLYQAILKEAAQYKLLLDFHGANKPTGQLRTWPNELTLESVKGMESSKLEDRATHETTIPFTRLLAGPAEYTVVMFNERRKNTTWAHQIASAAILSAPLLTYAANPENILSNPAADMIKSIPAVWDETIVLPGSAIGELAAFARRKGNTWFVAVMNGVGERPVKIPLGFLGKGTYKTQVVADDASNPAAVIKQQATYKNTDTISLTLQSGGGYIARFEQ